MYLPTVIFHLPNRIFNDLLSVVKLIRFIAVEKWCPHVHMHQRAPGRLVEVDSLPSPEFLIH